VYVINAYGGSGGTAPFILHLSIKQWYVHLHIQTTVSWGKCPQYPLTRRLSGPQKWPVCCEEQKNLLLLPAIVSQFFGCPSHTLITKQTKPPQLPSESLSNDNNKTFLREWRCWKYFSWKQTCQSKQIKAVEWEILVVVKDAVESIKQQWLMVCSLS